jgi:hypothetical protein
MPITEIVNIALVDRFQFNSQVACTMRSSHLTKAMIYINVQCYYSRMYTECIPISLLQRCEGKVHGNHIKTEVTITHILLWDNGLIRRELFIKPIDSDQTSV